MERIGWVTSLLVLTPPRLESELLKHRHKSIIVGRCSCGVEGCDDLIVKVIRSKNAVTWSSPEKGNVFFDANQYDAEIARFVQDKTWETLGRAVEREVEQILCGLVTTDSFRFDWASTRIKQGLIHLSFSKGHEQRLFELGWDGTSLANAIDRAKEFRAEHSVHRN